MEAYLIAHDLGTSGDKATLFRVDGVPVKSATVSYPVHYFGSHCAEQNPEDWWRAVCQSTKQITEGIDKKNILGLSFSAQMQGCLPVDAQGNALRPSMIWADHRAVEEKDALIDALGFDRIYEITGHRPNESYTIEKVMWLKKYEQDLYRRTYKILQAKDYIILRLTGNFVTDGSDASGTNALDLDTMQWSDEILQASGINRDLLPDLCKSTDVVGHITKEAAQATGLLEGMPVVCGGGDGPCSALGAGCIHENQLFTSFGTSAWIGGTTDRKFLDSRHVLMCFAHVIPGAYMPCGTMQAAGSSFSYIQSLLAPDQSYDTLDEWIEQSPAGAGGLLFLPYMIGERSPRWNEKTSGAFIGIRMNHDKKDYVRSVIEGIAFNLEIILQSYRTRLQVDSMILTGGGAKGDIVCQILADVFRAKLRTPDHVETATSIAAAMVTGIGVGVYHDFDEISRFLKIDREFVPDEKKQSVYEPLKKIFDDSYKALVPVFAELDSFRK